MIVYGNGLFYLGTAEEGLYIFVCKVVHKKIVYLVRGHVYIVSTVGCNYVWEVKNFNVSVIKLRIEIITVIEL